MAVKKKRGETKEMEAEKILVVDDNKEIVYSISELLKYEGYEILKAYDGMEALDIMERENVDLILLDVMMPRLNGLSALMKLREKSRIPVIILSAKTEESDKVSGLTLGADDYIEKPYDIDILLAKIKGIFKRRYQRSILSVNGVTLNLADRTAEIDGKPVELPAKEFDLLQLLMENQGKALKKEYLFNTVWGSDSNSELQTLHVHINRLRQKLGDDPKNAKRLITVWGVGYKFV